MVDDEDDDDDGGDVDYKVSDNFALHYADETVSELLTFDAGAYVPRRWWRDVLQTGATASDTSERI